MLVRRIHAQPASQAAAKCQVPPIPRPPAWWPDFPHGSRRKIPLSAAPNCSSDLQTCALLLKFFACLPRGGPGAAPAAGALWAAGWPAPPQAEAAVGGRFRGRGACGGGGGW
jgi:hypothetical protein